MRIIAEDRIIRQFRLRRASEKCHIRRASSEPGGTA
jgi:hypothetical protein